MSDTLAKLHNIAYFVSALACACEKNIGKGSHSICALAGKKFGREATKDVEQTDYPLKAIGILRNALKKQGIVWEFEPFAGEKSSAIVETDGKKTIRLAFHTCMVRNALFRYSHEQKQSLCYMAHGVFAGAMEQVLQNCDANLEIVHAGPNACLKELHLEVKK
jgi:predicted hydrocarbon binding protein